MHMCAGSCHVQPCYVRVASVNSHSVLHTPTKKSESKHNNHQKPQLLVDLNSVVSSKIFRKISHFPGKYRKISDQNFQKIP